MKIGIIREEKHPVDSRVAITPQQCAQLVRKLSGLEVYVQSSPHRCFADEEYREQNVPVCDSISHCDVLLGIKEVPIDSILPRKTYFIFSHTTKKQSYNRPLLQTMLYRNNTLIDYEHLVDSSGRRIIAFGKWAGIVGAHNAVRAWGKRTGTCSLQALHQCIDFKHAQHLYSSLDLNKLLKIVVTGAGRVSQGVCQTLDSMKFKRVTPLEFLKGGEYIGPVYTMLDIEDMYLSEDGSRCRADNYLRSPERHISGLIPYTESSDILINGIYWDSRCPKFFTKEQMLSDSFRIQVIADITCDIAPNASLPTTLRSSTIEAPVYGYCSATGRECEPYAKQSVDVMAVDNLPNELPRDSSEEFGRVFCATILPEFLSSKSIIISRATITSGGVLTSGYEYLQSFVDTRTKQR